ARSSCGVSSGASTNQQAAAPRTTKTLPVQIPQDHPKYFATSGVSTGEKKPPTLPPAFKTPPAAPPCEPPMSVASVQKDPSQNDAKPIAKASRTVAKRLAEAVTAR